MKIPEAASMLGPGPKLNRLVATRICFHTSGLPDESYAEFSGDITLALKAVDTFLSEHDDVKLTIEYPMPEVWLKRYMKDGGAGWIPTAYVTGETLPHALCLALLKAAGFESEITSSD